MQDDFWMQQALLLAQQAAEQGEVPVGAVLVLGGEIIGRGHNCPISRSDPSAHAEIITLRSAAQQLKNYRLPQTSLYVTLEPCLMCAGAIIQARVERLIFAADDPKTGACGSVVDIFSKSRLNHHTKVTGGILAAESSQLLSDFFKRRRLA